MFGDPVGDLAVAAHQRRTAPPLHVVQGLERLRGGPEVSRIINVLSAEPVPRA